MSRQPSSSKWTYEDYLLFPDDRKRYEIIDGERYVTPAPSTRHQRISGNLLFAFKLFLKAGGPGEVFNAPCEVVLSDLDVVQPDLLFVSSSRASIITEKNIQGPPDLVIEIFSETTRKTDELTKRKLYQKYGVAEYWIVDPELEMVKVYRLADQGYTRVSELAAEKGDMLSTPLLPGLEISVLEIFG